MSEFSSEPQRTYRIRHFFVSMFPITCSRTVLVTGSLSRMSRIAYWQHRTEIHYWYNQNWITLAHVLPIGINREKINLEKKEKRNFARTSIPLKDHEDLKSIFGKHVWSTCKLRSAVRIAEPPRLHCSRRTGCRSLILRSSHCWEYSKPTIRNGVLYIWKVGY